jgi:ankyrin repeat/BTB/POZ domain-containing protein 1
MKFIEIPPDTSLVQNPFMSDSPRSGSDDLLYGLDMNSNDEDEKKAILFYSLCEATRAGRLDKVRYLVEVEKVPLNRRDCWDSSPLYYSCLCGHKNLVTYLLENGARCEPNTFEAERCLYGALTDEIRSMLKTYNFTKAVDNLQPYAAFMYKLYYRADEYFHDVTFRVYDRKEERLYEINAHRCVMATRSPYFRREFLRRWRSQSAINVNHRRFRVSCFKLVLMWMYLGRIEFGLLGSNGKNVGAEELNDLLIMCKSWKLVALESSIRSMMELTDDPLDNSGNSRSLRNTRQGAHVGLESVQDDMAKLIKPLSDNRTHLTVMSLSSSVFADVILKVGNFFFPAHKSVLTGQSEYFQAMFSSNFSPVGDLEGFENVSSEKNSLPTLPIVNMNDIDDQLTADTFKLVMEYVYSDRVSIPSEKISSAYDLLFVSDMLLLDKLKSLSVVVLCGLLSSFTEQSRNTVFDGRLRPSTVEMDVSIFEITRAAMDLHIDRLEQHCIQFLAFFFDELSHHDEFKDLIKYSADSIKSRQEVDSIPFVDDLYWHLMNTDNYDYEKMKRSRAVKIDNDKEDFSGFLNVNELDKIRKIKELEDIVESLYLH